MRRPTHHAVPTSEGGVRVENVSRCLQPSQAVGDGGGCISVGGVEPDVCVAKSTTSVFAAYVDEIELMGVRISSIGRGEISHRSVFDCTKMFVFLLPTPPSALAVFLVAREVGGIAADDLGLEIAILRLKAAMAAALAADV